MRALLCVCGHCFVYVGTALCMRALLCVCEHCFVYAGTALCMRALLCLCGHCFVYASTALCMWALGYNSVTFAGCLITDKLKTLGVTFDAALDYVNHIPKACSINIWVVYHICCFISLSVLNIMVACIVDTRLDYCNALLHGAAEKFLNKLQRVQVAYQKLTVSRSRTKSSHSPDRAPKADSIQIAHQKLTVSRSRTKS